MIGKIEHIGQAPYSSGRKVRRFFADLFGSKYAQFLERELIQVRMEKDRQISDMRAENSRLIEALMATKGIPLRPIAQPSAERKPVGLGGPTTWQNLVAAEQEKVAREEAAEMEKEN